MQEIAESLIFANYLFLSRYTTPGLVRRSNVIEVTLQMRMTRFALSALAALSVGTLAVAAAPQANAQISVSIGAPPQCPYGYYDYAPYNCAPYGYYGPEWFNGGVFIGAGRWFHGPANFHGGVNTAFDPRHGYHGPMPGHGAPQHHPDNFKSFHATESHDSGGHVFNGGDHGGRH
jgi:hypothetical protein